MKNSIRVLLILIASVFSSTSFSLELISNSIPEASVGNYMFKEIQLESMVSAIADVASQDGYKVSLDVSKPTGKKVIQVFAHKYPWPNIIEDIAYRNNLKLRLDKDAKHIYITE
ncbi:hypothetical protein ACOYR1_02745 [Thalassotalea piscium]